MRQNKLIIRRIGIILTFLSLFSIAAIFEFGVTTKCENLLEIIMFIFIGIFLLSLQITFIKTGLWKFTHKPLAKLDERELILTNKSLRLAYGIFAVTLLLLLLIFSVSERSLSIVLVATLIIFAHLLPAAIIAWTKKQ